MSPVQAELPAIDGGAAAGAGGVLAGDAGGRPRFAARLQQVFGVEVPLRHVLGNPTVAGLAEAMEADPATGARVRRVAELPAELADAEAGGAPAIFPMTKERS
ncbi:MAG: phosphopantetheine-binding protein [Longimicrobiaceae bacterium]